MDLSYQSLHLAWRGQSVLSVVRAGGAQCRLGWALLDGRQLEARRLVCMTRALVDTPTDKFFGVG